MSDTSTDTANTLLSLKNVGLTYRALPALRRIEWSIFKGQHWAVIGANGAGKTSIARIVSGQARHTGQVTLDDKVRNSGVNYVCFEQAKALCERDRKLDTAEFSADAQDAGTRVIDMLASSGASELDITDLCQRVGIDHILNRGLRFISTGEMRKTLLASAILAKPGLLLLDNPLDGLDKASQTTLAAIIEELQTDGMPVIVFCRQPTDIPTTTTHVLAMSKGEVLASGEAEHVLARPEVASSLMPPLPELEVLPPPFPRSYTLEEQAPLLRLRDVAVRYGELQVLAGVNWRFARGQHCCVAGPNGCGKTTLLSLITGDNHKAYGQDIELFGVRRGSGESVWDIKQKFGQVDTQLHLNFAARMRVIEVVVSGYFDSLGLYDNWGDSQRQGAQEWLNCLGLGDIANANFDELSFGLQRMVLLARAMVKSPAILLLDEPTLGLDGYHRALILRAVDHIVAHADTQVIFVSHSAGEIPQCINQFLHFEPADAGFNVSVR